MDGYGAAFSYQATIAKTQFFTNGSVKMLDYTTIVRTYSPGAKIRYSNK